MAEIGATSHTPNWPASSKVTSMGDAKQSPKRQSQKGTQDGDSNRPVGKKINKKKPPGNNINPHIDEYA